MGILLCEQNFRNVWIRNESVRAQICQILHTDTHTTAAKLVVRIIMAKRTVLRLRKKKLRLCSFGGADCFCLKNNTSSYNVDNNNNGRNGSCLTWLATSLGPRGEAQMAYASPRGQCSK